MLLFRLSKVNSDYAEEEGGIQFITLEPVFIQKGDTRINYVVNAPAGAMLKGSALTGLTDNTQPKLVLDSAVNLHDGEGFSVANYTLIGWSDKPLQPSTNPIHLKDDGSYEGTIPEDVHIFKPGGKYGVSDEDGNTLYAVWERKTIPVPFTKQGEKTDGTYELLADAEFRLYTDPGCATLVSNAYSEISANESIVRSKNDSGTNVIFPKVPVGTFYFKETSVGNDYKLDGTVHTIAVTEENDGTLSYTIDGIYSPENTFVLRNYRKGTLAVTKTVDSVMESDLTKEFHFTAVVLDDSGQIDTSFNGECGEVTFADGIASFTLTHESEKKIRNLGGKTIRIQEENATAYLTTATAETGSYVSGSRTYTITVPADGATVAFTNRLEGVPVKVLKVDQAGAALEGAGFYFTGKDFDGNEVSGTRYISRKTTAEGEAIIIEREAVSPGTYILREETVPAGYVGLDGDVEITISAGTDGTMEASLKIGDTAITSPNFISKEDDGTWIIKVQNSAGYELPSTGGIGTHVFTISGSILILGAGLLLWRRRQRV